MRSIAILAAGLCALVAACDQNSNDVVVKGQDGSVTVSANGQHVSINANGGKDGSFTMSGDNGHFTMKASDGKQTVEIHSTGGSHDIHMPDFVTSYPGAKTQSTTIGSSVSGTGGTVTFQTSDSPSKVIAFYKQKASGAGLSQGVDVNMGPTTMFTANANGGKKELQVVASTDGGGARVQVNWSEK